MTTTGSVETAEIQREWDRRFAERDIAHLPQPARGELHRATACAVVPGGRLVLVAHDRSNLDRGIGGPSDPAVLPTAEEVRDELSGLELIRCEIVERTVQGTPRPVRALVAVGARAPRPS